jgi:hypothetical protein
MMHVVQAGEDHDLDVGCWCQPTWDETVWVHHSRDGREMKLEALGPMTISISH